LKNQGFSRYETTRRGTHWNGFSQIQVLVLIPGVGVQVPPRAPKASISKEIGAFFYPLIPDFGDLKK